MNNFIDELIKHNAKIYLVGGAIRNIIYNYYFNKNITIKDRDLLICNINMNMLINILNKYGDVKSTSISFGVIKFTEYENNIEFDIALPRKEISTGPKYTDFIVQSDPNINIVNDFERRDATINSIAKPIFIIDDLYNNSYNFNTLIDPFNGYQDIKNKIWKSVGNPLIKFNEDPSRILRAFRQSAELQFNIEDSTFNCIKNNLYLIDLIKVNSTARIIDELLRILNCDCPYILVQMQSVNLFKLLDIPSTNIDILINLTKNTNIKIKLALLLDANININSYNWCIKYNITESIYFNKNWINFIECVSKKYDKIKIISTNYDMRIFIQEIEKNYKNFGRDYACDLINYYNIKNNNISLIDLYNKNKDFLLDINEIDINGFELNNLYKLKGIQIKNIKEHLLDKINRDQLINNKNSIIIYLNSILNS